ncbi:HET-domain-containing protein [Curvularia clavata]|uniref:HET-domain-containing protein n=1 Tax=Curvularia clavata TaxID=95742 RepID=A0A9Q9DSZ5_CURCL|nr:HET-domain-containing protein [Curvularia clavata]
MRLINCTTLQLEEFFGSNIPRYAVLSHTWGDDEVTFVDLPLDSPTTKAKAGYQKIEFTCQQALCNGLNFAWVDTCCIDKRSSSELSEAINSMFSWYRNARHCYAYLSDVLQNGMGEEFCASRWFTRGWTLQELLAPSNVTFYNRQWEELGQKSKHAALLSWITGIDANALMETSKIVPKKSDTFGAYCVAKKMSWASKRETTRTEDMAYCLLGIFDINMPLLYGEGDRAFRRLQEEIIRRVDDDSILAWGLDLAMEDPSGHTPEVASQHLTRPEDFQEVLADSPKDFANCGSLEYAAGSTAPLTLTSVGLTIELPLIPVHDRLLNGPFQKRWIGLLSCSVGDSRYLLGLLICSIYRDAQQDKRTARITRAMFSRPTGSYSTILLGPGSALSASVDTLTITGFFKTQKKEAFHQYSLDIVFADPGKVLDSNFQIAHAKSWISWEYRAIIHNKDPIWDQEVRVLTVIRPHQFYAIIVEICIKLLGWPEDPTLTIFVHTGYKRVMLRRGDNFSDEERHNFCYLLLGDMVENHHDYIELQDSEGKMRKIVVSLRSTMVYQREVFQLRVDSASTDDEETEFALM